MSPSFILDLFRKIRFKFSNKKLNQQFTLIANNCIAGCVLHDYKMRFDTPTINLYIPFPDYILFLQKFEYFINADFEEIKEEGATYPIGLLGGEIKVHFLHYHSFDQAIESWRKRVKRIHHDNIKVVLVERDGCTAKDLMDFDKLPFTNKVALTRRNDLNLKSTFHFKGYDDKDELGNIMFYKGLFGKKIYDQFDWWSFLNK
jgi:uncharacterized protein (DUF1919 family)